MKRLSSVVFLFVILSQLVSGQTIAVQGVLRDPAGRTVADGSHNVVFKLYDAQTGGTELWSESLGSVETSHGVFSVQLGASSSLETLSFTDKYWLGIQVDDGSEISQRLALQSSPAANALTGSANIIPSVGNAGIGTILPTADFEIQSSDNGSKLKVSSSHVDSAPIFEVQQENSDGKLSVRNAGGATISQLSGYSETPTFFNTSVGIGTETPTEPLDVAGNVKLSNGGALIFSDNTSLSTAELSGSASAIATPGNALITADADEAGAGEIQFKTGTGTDMVITNDGKVGIGVTDPSNSLEVSGGTSLNTLGVSGETSLTTLGVSGGTILNDLEVNDLGVNGQTFLTDRLMLMRLSGTNYIDFHNDNSLQFRSMGTGDVTVKNLLALSPTGELSIGSQGNGSLFNVRSSISPYNKIFEVEQSSSDGKASVRNASGSTITQLSGFASTPSYFMSKVGIGNTNPGIPLDVGTGATHNGGGGFQILASSTSSAAMGATVGGRTLYLYTSPTAMKLDAYDYNTNDPLDLTIAGNGGNVGIGTATPTTKLDVAGRITRHGQDMSASSYISHGGTIDCPWGTTDDWSIFVSIRSMGADETGSNGDNALMEINCYPTAIDGNTWQITARYLYRFTDNNGAWANGSANVLLVAK